ncbi:MULTISPECIES: lysylphosphatidylglycerol synthase domain-containing protein [unclassified Aeromicrobium]|uniref:lysylphosphatidylglycerol synthase domain-containing protein n=1 Tax=unclassified Aeromicrobium TaxID=2633570 RepID=UPI00396B2B34
MTTLATTVRARHGAFRLAAGVVIVLVLVRQLGADPFVDGLRAVRPWAVPAAVLLTAGTTWCCARRWTLVAQRHDVPLPLGVAYAAYYRSQLLNVVLPGGVVGDVHRGVRHGWRGVLWERGIGQAVQIGLVGVLVLPHPWRWWGVAAFVLSAVALGAIVTWSALSTVGHLLVFVIAAQPTGLPLSTVLPIGALVLLGAACPLNVAGWGPREGVAASAFAAFGSTAATGLTVAVTFGVLSSLATLPGLLVLARHATGEGAPT